MIISELVSRLTDLMEQLGDTQVTMKDQITGQFREISFIGVLNACPVKLMSYHMDTKSLQKIIIVSFGDDLSRQTMFMN